MKNVSKEIEEILNEYITGSVIVLLDLYNMSYRIKIHTTHFDFNEVIYQELWYHIPEPQYTIAHIVLTNYRNFILEKYFIKY